MFAFFMPLRESLAVNSLEFNQMENVVRLRLNCH